MKIEMTCKCGATFSIDDPDGRYISNPPDPKGRKYILEVQAEQWQEQHKGCLGVTKVAFSGVPGGGGGSGGFTYEKESEKPK